jgi:hypothetical protein
MNHVKSLALLWLAGSGGKGTVSRLKAGLEPLLDRGEYASVEAALEQLDEEGSIDLSRGAVAFTQQGKTRVLRLLRFTSLVRGWTWPKFRDTVLLPLALRRWLAGEESGSPERDEPRAVPEHPRSAPVKSAPATIEERIRAAYLRVTGGALNQYVKLAQLRAQLRDEPVEVVDDELRRMQQRGGAVLYPIDDPQRLRPGDDAAALRVAGERRDLLLIRS